MPAVIVANPISIGNISDAKLISAGNSTNTPLGASATFTGTFESTMGASALTILIFQDQNSAVDGLVVEWSSNGVDVDETDKFTLSANKGKQFSFGIPGQYFRIKYTNDTTPQSVFRMQTILHPFPMKPSSHRLSDNLDDNDDAELVKAIIAAKSPSGEYLNLTTNEFGQLQIVGTVSLAAPPPPLASTPVAIENATPLSTTGTTTVDYTITNGTTFTLSSVSLGVEGDPTEKGTKLEVFYVDSGGTPHIIERIYAAGFTVEKFPNTNRARNGTLMVGNGVNTLIRVIRTRLSGGSLEVDGLVRGYEL